jgi:hypothetical protein
MRSLIVAALLVFAERPAVADANPWEKNVPDDVKKLANADYRAANDLFAQKAYGQAVAKYRAALDRWDHPQIRFNLAVVLIRLDRFVEAADELALALRYGAKPFDRLELYDQALDYQAVLRARVGTVEASCKLPGAQVVLDGKPWFTCPGKQAMRVASGEHAIVTERSGYLTRTKRFVLLGGDTASHDIELVRLDQATRYRYPRWIQWSMIGGGLAIGVGGLAVWSAGRTQMSNFEAKLTTDCPLGCDLASDEFAYLADRRDRARLKGNVGIGLMLGGGAIAIAGGIFAGLNRIERVGYVDVTPRPGGASAAVGWRF